jgi:GAF domain-containing protein
MSKTGQIIKGDYVSVALFNPAQDKFDEFLLYQGEISLGAQWPLEGTAMGQAIQENRAIITTDLSHSSFLEHNRLAEQGLWSSIIMPLLAGGRVVGTLNVSSRTLNAYGPKDEKLLLQITSLLAAAIENRRLFEQTQKRARREQILREITSQVRSSVDVDTILQTAAKEVGLALERPAFVYLSHQSNNASDAKEE